jgi:hypothetical protein
LIKLWQINAIKHSIVAIVIIEALLVLSFVFCAITTDRGAPFSADRFRRLGNPYRAWKLPTFTKATLLGRNAQETELMHQDATATFLRGRSDALVIGGLGLTAWAVLVTQASGHVGSAALRLLLFGVAVTLVAPCLIRSGPSEGSYLTLSALGAIGYVAVLFAVLLGAANYFKIGWFSSLVTVLAPMVVIAVLVEAVGEFRRIKRIFMTPSSEVAPAAQSSSSGEAVNS